MKILMASTYYVPHISGFTLYAQTLAEKLHKKGISLTLLTYQHQKDLPLRETIDGINVIRVPTLLGASRGVFSPEYFIKAVGLIPRHNLVHLHHPMLELGPLVFMSKIFRKPSVITYHCDLHLPKGAVNFLAEHTTNFSFRVGAYFADKIVAYSKDFAQNSTFLPNYQAKTSHIYPPIRKMEPASPVEVEALRKKQNLKAKTIIGYAGRISEEKGADILIASIPHLKEKLSDFKVVFAGEYRNVKGESFYNQLKPLLNQYREQIYFLGHLEPESMTNFYKLIDVLVVPSRRETFAMVQIEAMLQGTPVVTTDVYGARVPIRETGMGEIAKIADSKDLASKIIRVIEDRDTYIRSTKKVRAIFNPVNSINSYLELYEKLLHQPSLK